LAGSTLRRDSSSERLQSPRQDDEKRGSCNRQLTVIQESGVKARLRTAEANRCADR
jgi:hypothetical protein